jgi:hypothetical protein
MTAPSKGRKRVAKTSSNVKAAKQGTCLQVRMSLNESQEAASARYALEPAIGCALTSSNYRPIRALDTDINFVVAELERQCEKVSSGDMSRVEHILIAQMHSLDAVFNNLANRAHLNIGEYPEATECYLKLAMRAQSQCRATAEALANIKNPTMVYAKQANIAHGPQQVNNEAVPLVHAGQTKNQPNELLESNHGEWMDTRTAGTTSDGNPAMAAMDVINGTKNKRRQGEGKA